MAQRIAQFRYFGDGDSRNYPPGLTAQNLSSEKYITNTLDGKEIPTITYTYLKISCPVCINAFLKMKSNGQQCSYQIADSGLLELKGIYCSNFWFELEKLKHFISTFRKATQGSKKADIYPRDEFADPRLIIDVY